jgi:hypothetical protein
MGILQCKKESKSSPVDYFQYDVMETALQPAAASCTVKWMILATAVIIVLLLRAIAFTMRFFAYQN